MFPESQIAALRLLSPVGEKVTDCDFQFSSLAEVNAFRPHAAVIASPAPQHVEIASNLIGLGIPVLVEKPFSHSLGGLRELVSQAEAADVPLMVGYNLRFKSSLLDIRRRLCSGEIGDVISVRAEVGQYLPEWRPGSDYRKCVSAQAEQGGGVLLELSHEIDYLYWMFGIPAQVSCRGGKYSALEIDVEDVVELCMEYASPRRLVSVHLDFIQRVPYRSCKFIGSTGTILWDGIGDIVTLLRPDHRPVQEHLPSGDRDATYVAELEHFLKCVGLGRKPDIDGRSGYDVLAIVEAAKRSLQNATVERPTPYAG
jgi:predicted dehydrogenase